MTETLTTTNIVAAFRNVRRRSEDIAEPLEVEDMVIQSMPDVSPTKWHLAHTTWFFETFLLKPTAGYQIFDNAFEVLFNSYYNSVGEQFSRPNRGLLSRPTVPAVFAYRRHIDTAMERLISQGISDDQQTVIEIGLNHEQQHQELMLTDIKHVLSVNPLFPAYVNHGSPKEPVPAGEEHFVEFDDGLCDIGTSETGFSYDNEGPRHTTFLQPFAISDRLVTNHAWTEFIDDGGYSDPQWWTSLGWSTVKSNGWLAPGYWQKRGSDWYAFTLTGLRPVDLDEAVVHISWLEADAFARWKSDRTGAPLRLPTEAEWEHAADSSDLSQLFDVRWQWTASPYTPYPGYRPAPGALGEYNGKFMTQQYVLRGSSGATSPGHSRLTYRNFFPPEARWQFTGLRLAKDVAHPRV